MKAKLPLQALALALLVSLGMTIACSKAPNDAQIMGEVQMKVNANSNLKGKQIQAVSSGGVVTLSGTVDSDFQRTAAANEAAQVAGVKTVVNDLQIAEPVAEQAPPAQETAPPPAPKPSAASKPRHHSKTDARRRQSDQMAENSRSEREYNENRVPSPALENPPAAEAMPAPAPVEIEPQPVSVPQGSPLAVRLIDPLSSETSQVGDSFRATLSSPVRVDGQTVIPANADLEGKVVAVKSAAHFAGQSLLTLQLTHLAVNGKSYDLQTSEWSKQGAARGKRTAETVGGGSVLGAIIGGIAGGGKGAAIGAAAGAGAGAGVQGVTKGEKVELPSETVLNFTLDAPLTVMPSSKRNR